MIVSGIENFFGWFFFPGWKGIFGSVIKDIKGPKSKSENDAVIEDSKASIEALSITFSVPNFPFESENERKSLATKDDLHMDIGTFYCRIWTNLWSNLKFLLP